MLSIRSSTGNKSMSFDRKPSKELVRSGCEHTINFIGGLLLTIPGKGVSELHGLMVRRLCLIMLLGTTLDTHCVLKMKSMENEQERNVHQWGQSSIYLSSNNALHQKTCHHNKSPSTSTNGTKDYSGTLIRTHQIIGRMRRGWHT
jgi:hypothetical protein